MDSQQTTQPISNTDYDGVQKALQSALKVADESFGKDFADWWSALDHDVMKTRLAEDIDMPETGFSRRHLVNTLGESRKRLEAYIQKVASQEDFAQMCYEYIEAEMEELFFVTNNRAEAKMVQDYFLRFLSAATGALKATGQMESDVARQCEVFKEYYAIGFESYDDLREIVHEASGGTTTSIAALALATHADDESVKRGIAQLPRLTEGSQAARDMIKAMTVPAYSALLEREYGLSREPHQNFHFSTSWICYQARELASAQHELHAPRRFSKKAAYENSSESIKLEHALVNRVHEMLQKEGDVFGLIDASVMFHEMRAAANQVPEAFADMLEDACVRAEGAAEAAFPEIHKNHLQYWAALPPAKSSALGKNAWPNLDTWSMDHGVAKDIGGLLTERIVNASSPLRVARRAEQVVDEMIVDVMLGMVSPSQLRYAEMYLKTIRRTLGGSFQDVGEFQAEAFVPLKKLEAKCAYAYENAAILREWVLDASDHKFDRLYQQQYLKHALETGKAIHQIAPAEWANSLMPKAAKVYRGFLKKYGFYERGKDHVMMPLVVQRARGVADAELGACPSKETGATDEEIADFHTQYWERVRKLVHETLAGMPDRDPLTGHSHRRHPFSADDLHEVVTDLERRSTLLSHRGTRH